MKVNLGCGSERIAGFINVDIRPIGDFEADVRALPWPDGIVTHVIAHDILEHFPANETSKLLREWNRVMEHGAVIEFRVPNMRALCALVVEDDNLCPAYIRNIYGGHRYGNNGEYDTHHTGWTPRLFHELLTSHGFEVESNDNEINMNVVARKVKDATS